MLRLSRVPWVIVAMATALPVAFAEAPEKPTFYKDVLPILQENCQVCHRPEGANLGGMIAPMSFATYEETRPWAKAMAKNVAAGSMPPWHAAPEHHGVFNNERTLTQDQIDTIVRWARQGAKKGSPKEAPEQREWPVAGGWTIGEPDLIVKMPESYFVKDDVEDLYVSFQTKITQEMLPEDRWMKAIEFRPGSPVVHHIIALPLGGIAPGNDATVYPDGLAMKLRSGTTVSWQMHYHKEPGPGTGSWDQSMAAIKFYPKDAVIQHELEVESLGRFDFAIPPGDPNYTMQVDYIFPRDTQIVSLMPHMHLRGKSATYEAFYPDGSSEILLNVPRYDFNWQTAYRFKDFKQIPAGTKLVFTAVWDNSDENPYNPDPTETVYWGQPTTAEMGFGFMGYFETDPSQQAHAAAATRSRRRGLPPLTQIVKMMDKNKDGKLSKEEAVGPLKNFFSRIDLNEDGFIDMDEAETAQKLLAQRGGN